MKIIKISANLLIINLLLICQNVFAQQNKPLNETDKILTRVVSARIFYKNTWTLPNITPEFVGENLAKLNPTYISGLIQLDDQTPLSDKHIQAFQKIQEIVWKTNATCKFDFNLNPRQYKKPEDLVAKMTEINSKIKVNIWFLDFYRGEFKGDYKVIKAAIDYAHTQGQIVGTNDLDNTNLKLVDFITVHDGNGVENKLRDEIAKLSNYELSVGLMINNDTEKTSNDNIHTFIKKWQKHNREAHIKRLSRNQATWKYRFFYPLFFPVYLNQTAYNGVKDGDMIKIYLDLMKLYN